MFTKISYGLIFLAILVTCNSCFQSNANSKLAETLKSDSLIKDGKKAEEDCDEKEAKEKLEKIKAEEFSLLNNNDAGCEVEEQKPVAIPSMPTTK